MQRICCEAINDASERMVRRMGQEKMNNMEAVTFRTYDGTTGRQKRYRMLSPPEWTEALKRGLTPLLADTFGV